MKEISLIERLKFIENKSIYKKKVVYLYDAIDSSTFRYRVFNMCEAINTYSEDYCSTYLFVDEINQENVSILNDVNLFIFCRTKWTPFIESLIDYLSFTKKRFIYDVDDLIVIPSVLSEFLSYTNLYKEYEKYFLYSTRLYSVARKASGIIVTNSYFANLMRQYFPVSVYVIKNFINSSQIEKSKITYECENTLGYFSGSNTHNLDFTLLNNPLDKFFKENPSWKLRAMGHIDLPSNFDEKWVERIPFVNSEKYLLEVAKTKVNLVPLIDNEFTNCKSELKYFESALFKRPSIISNIESYSNIIKNGYNGFLVNGESEWGNALGALKDQETYNKIGENAYSHVINTYSPKCVLPQIEKVFNNFLN